MDFGVQGAESVCAERVLVAEFRILGVQGVGHCIMGEPENPPAPKF